MSSATISALRRVSQLARTPRYFAQVRPTFQHPTRPSPILSAVLQQRRLNSSSTTTRAPEPYTERDDLTPEQVSDLAARKALEPAYDLSFTCRQCLTRSTHRVTKQAYHKGTTLITCKGCKNRHLISDHLKVFSDKSITLEDILREKGEFLRKGRLGEDGDIEFYEEEGVQEDDRKGWEMRTGVREEVKG